MTTTTLTSFDIDAAIGKVTAMGDRIQALSEDVAINAFQLTQVADLLRDPQTNEAGVDTEAIAQRIDDIVAALDVAIGLR